MSIPSLVRDARDLRVGVVFATYDRPDRSSPQKLERAIESLRGQQYQDWKLFLVSDSYSDKAHLQKITTSLPPNSVVILETNRASHLDRHHEEVVLNAGVEAYKVGLMALLGEGFDLGCQLTDDDFWYPEHLQVLVETYLRYPQAVILYTQALYRNQPYPNLDVPIAYNNLPPGYTVEGDYKRLNQVLTSMMFRVSCFRDRVQPRSVIEQGRMWPSDMDFVQQIMLICEAENLLTVFIPQVTVHHEIETSDLLSGPDVWKG